MTTRIESLQHPSHHHATSIPAHSDVRLAGLAILASAIVSTATVALDRGASGKTTQEILQNTARWMIDMVEVGATDAQKSTLDPIFKQAVADLLPMFQQLHTGHAQVRDLLMASTINRAALEQARAAQIAVDDQISQRMTRLVEDSGNVLTQDQRR